MRILPFALLAASALNASDPFSFFAENTGQDAAGVKYRLYGVPKGTRVYLKSNAIHLRDTYGPGTAFRFAAGDPGAYQSLERWPGTFNYFQGEPGNWRRGIPAHRRVQYTAIAPGLDAVFAAADGASTLTYILSPGATPDSVFLESDSTQPASLNAASGTWTVQPRQKRRNHRPLGHRRRRREPPAKGLHRRHRKRNPIRRRQRRTLANQRPHPRVRQQRRSRLARRRTRKPGEGSHRTARVSTCMPAAVEVHSAQPPPGARRRLTRVDCQALETAGLLDWERFELIDGALIRKTPQSPLHSFALLLLMEWLRGVFGARHVLQEVSFELGALLSPTNQPEPDASILRRSALEFRTTSPGPPDLLLVAEVSATTQDYDLGAKAALYAGAGIAEYWVLDLQGMRIVVHRNPVGERYNPIIAYAADEAVSPSDAPANSIRPQDLVQ